MANFFDHDEAHSKAKRFLLKNTISALIPRRLQKTEALWSEEPDQQGRYALTYLDAFSGPGSYGNPYFNTLFDYYWQDVCNLGTPLVAICVATEQMAKLKERVFPVRFIFNDVKEEYIDTLIDLVSHILRSSGWEEIEVSPKEDWKYVKAVEYSKMFNSKRQSILVIYTNYEFKEMTFLENIPPPAISVIDPFGIAQIPMESIRWLIGEEKDFFINLMVAPLNWALDASDDRQSFAQSLFGENKFCFDMDTVVQRLHAAWNIDEKRRILSTGYQDKLKKEHGFVEDQLYTSAFAFKTKNMKKDSGIHFYIVFGTTSLSRLQNFKTAMQSITQEPSEPIFSDFVFYNNIQATKSIYERSRRLTTDKDEAEVIYNHFKDREGPVRLGEVKRFVIAETPFPYHARGMKVLEDSGRLSVGLMDDLYHPVKRRKGDFRCFISKTPFEDGIKYGNYWLLTFKREETR